jgi:4-diphosphocytidyl-2-C-methyl-D-erythritol kinase
MILEGHSPAKLNLTLRVVGLRQDGFHEIESLVARIDLCDTVIVAKRRAGLSVECSDPSIPADETNLALRAARALADAQGVRQGAHIRLQKRIPAGGGLGGGSSNAATTLLLLNELWSLGLERDALARIGAKLGSDVLLFFRSPLCVLRGRGERVEELAESLDAWAALVLPPMTCATARVYAAWDGMREQTPRPRLTDVLVSLELVDGVMTRLFNDLEAPAYKLEPDLGQLARLVSTIDNVPVRMTGSGSTLFRLFSKRFEAERFAAAVTRAAGVPTAVARVQQE